MAVDKNEFATSCEFEIAFLGMVLSCIKLHSRLQWYKWEVARYFDAAGNHLGNEGDDVSHHGQ